MSMPQRSASTDSAAESLRKRVCKACDRCRLKKSKCDGASPCSRCKADNAICVFGERKKSHDKVYPKGYVEMLEQQQGQLVSGLQEMYHRLLEGQRWSGPTLSEATGHPLTHDILAALNLLESKNDGSGEMESFEEDCEKLQSRLFKAGAPYMRRKASFSSESEHSQQLPTAQNTPHLSKQAMFKEPLSFSPSPSPLPASPPARHRQTYPPAQQPPNTTTQQQLSNDPQLYQPEWALSNLRNPAAIMRSKYAMQTPMIQQGYPEELLDLLNADEWADSGNLRYDSPMDSMASYPGQFSNSYSGNFPLQDFGNIDPMDLEFNRWIQVST